MSRSVTKTIMKIGIVILVCYLLLVAIVLVVRPGYEVVSVSALPRDFPFVAFWQEGDTEHCQIFRWFEYDDLSRMKLKVSLEVQANMLSVCQRDIEYLDEHGVWPMTFDWQDARNSWPLVTFDSTFGNNHSVVFVVSYQPDSNHINQSRYLVANNDIQYAEYKAYEIKSVAMSVLPVAVALFLVFVIVFGLTKALQRLESMEQQDK